MRAEEGMPVRKDQRMIMENKLYRSKQVFE